MPPITVDPDVLSGAGESIGAVGEEIAAAVNTLASGLAGGARSGLDPAGLAFGHAYGQSAQALLDAGAAAVSAGRGIGFGVQMSATNYSRADASSTIGGGASTLTPPDAPAEFSAPASPSALGGGVPPSLLWSVIQTFIPDVWPDGDPAALRATASAWQGFASTMNRIVGQLAGPSGVVAGQQIPEGGNMTSAISELTQSLSGIASEAGKLATQTLEFADDIENTQNAIRDLLDRVSPSGLLDGLSAVFSGDVLEELKEIADDIKTVLATMSLRSVNARTTSPPSSTTSATTHRRRLWPPAPPVVPSLGSWSIRRAHRVWGIQLGLLEFRTRQRLTCPTRRCHMFRTRHRAIDHPRPIHLRRQALPPMPRLGRAMRRHERVQRRKHVSRPQLTSHRAATRPRQVQPPMRRHMHR